MAGYANAMFSRVETMDPSGTPIDPSHYFSKTLGRRLTPEEQALLMQQLGMTGRTSNGQNAAGMIPQMGYAAQMGRMF